ncbi:hypothetical protein ACXYTJ_07855 [Gilvimarinus sp. F26214L]|uniref:hypothetical protein n=1 Tax=Gilvimarinus sp. DZF01 TaxID=3461371 RepID=UPI004045B9D4
MPLPIALSGVSPTQQIHRPLCDTDDSERPNGVPPRGQLNRFAPSHSQSVASCILRGPEAPALKLNLTIRTVSEMDAADVSELNLSPYPESHREKHHFWDGCHPSERGVNGKLVWTP